MADLKSAAQTIEKYLRVQKNSYLCYNEINEEQPKMSHRRKARNRNQKVYAYRRCLYV